jgi:hypothetical protein
VYFDGGASPCGGGVFQAFEHQQEQVRFLTEREDGLRNPNPFLDSMMMQFGAPGNG